jgi:hypothetical protein
VAAQLAAPQEGLSSVNTFELPPTWRAPLEDQIGPVIPPGTRFLIRRLLRLAGLRTRLHAGSVSTASVLLRVYLFLQSRDLVAVEVCLLSRFLATTVISCSDIPAFSRHVKLILLHFVINFEGVRLSNFLVE